MKYSGVLSVLPANNSFANRRLSGCVVLNERDDSSVELITICEWQWCNHTL